MSTATTDGTETPHTARSSQRSDLLRDAGLVLAWFVVAGLVAGLVWWRLVDSLAMVVLVVLGGGLAAFLASQLGRWLGPGSAQEALRDKANGAHAPMPLEVHASGVLLVWPAAAALGALLYLWVIKSPESD